MELQFHDVAKRYGAKEALRGIDLTLTPGVYGLLGPNGAGKSTLMNILTGNLRPTRGRVTLDGQDTVSMGEAFRRRLGYCPQQQALYPGFTGEQFLYYMASLQGMAREDAKERMDWALARLDLTEAAGRPIRGWSGGMKQRVGIARALAVKPEFIVCDEPISALDVSIQAQIINLLNELQDKYKLTYLFISHDLSVVEHISDTVGVMYLGNLVEYGAKEDIFRNPLHPYTKALFSAIPIPDPKVKMNRIVLEGSIPSPANPPKGCKFHTRCANCMACCKEEAPVQREIEPGHFVCCHLYDK